MKRVMLWVAALGVAGAGAVAAVIFGGLYDISATDQHLAPTYWAVDKASRESVRRRARPIVPPPLEEPAKIERGLALFRDNCVACHGAPGVAPAGFALGMAPSPANLVDTARNWSAAEVYWTVRHGYKMTGMPAWEFRMPDDDLWAIVAFVRTLPALSPAEYRRRAGAAPRAAAREDPPLVPDAGRGKVAIQQYACPTCHEIPGIVGANKPVGPPLDRFGKRGVIAGILPNSPENLVRWLRQPQEVSPESAMPDLGVTERDARDIAAYLSTLR